MSDKNGGHNGAQWTKATAAALLAAQQKQPAHHPAAMGPTHHQQQQSMYSPTAHLMPAHTPLLAHPDGIAPYASARFHPPIPSQALTHHPATIQHASAHQQPPLTHAPTTVLTAPSSASPNVPAQSGFVPPPLLPTAVAAATSVLTPNPFAVTEQFSHLNTQQQLNKIMTAMQQHASNAASATTSSAAMTSPHTQSVRQHVVDLPMSSGSSGSAAGSVSGNAAVGGAAATGASGGAINSTIAENVLNAISAAPNNSLSASVPAVHGRLMGIGVKVPDDDKLRRIQHVVESGVSELAKQQILQILDRISTLKPVEKLLLYLRLPGDAPETDPLRHPQNPLGTRSEINHTINWVRSHLEHDPKVSIPKQDVYNDYLAYCDRLEIKPLSTADFGKVMKQVFPGIRPRRLGTRGHSRYCYAAMRKTTKLTAPQLPQIDSASVAQANESSADGNVNDPSMLAHTGDVDSWEIVKAWAERMLHTKVDSVQELAVRIKDAGGVAGSSGDVDAVIASTTTTHGRAPAANLTHHKKYTPREPKEKRHLADMGPLKKRRKKKRKGSSSSESNCSQPLQPAPFNTSQSQGSSNNSNYPDLSHIRSGIVYTAEDKPSELIQVKQEVLESPNLQHVQAMPGPTHMQADSYLQQQLPMNLVTEQRTVLARAPPAASAFGVVQPQQRATFPTSSSSAGAAAVKNLTPKIIEMSAAAAATPAAPAVAIGADHVTTIKEEEFTDEYNPNIFCKKVRKAQQTKGFWTNSPTAPSNVVPIITTTPASVTTQAETAASIPAMAAPQAAATSATLTPAAIPSAAVGVVSPSFLMGPPAQIGSANTSTSPSNALLGDAPSPSAASPKVASRNTMQLRAKRLQLAAAAAAAVANVDSAGGSAGGGLPDADAADLPSNLGLPRERVISICNMDKHELDDYLMPAEEEEEDQEDQETELLQYFQTGDAEENLNSLDAANNRNPTATATTTTTTVTATVTTTAQQVKALVVDLPQAPAQLQTTPNAVSSANKAPKDNGLLSTAQCFVPAVTVSTTAVSQLPIVSFAAASTNSSATTMTPAVGSASASLALMSQKHQQQHHQQRPNLTQLPRNANGNSSSSSSSNSKRKINLSGTAVNPADVMVPRKNCFLPISPNINSGINNSTGTVTASGIGGSNSTGVNNFFISPGQGAQRVRPKPTFFFSKQLSLENDSSDPMIGAIRRRRSYASLISNSNGGFMPTSASAPPSPSLLHQQQQQQLYNNATHFLGGGNSCLQAPTSAASGYNEIGSNSSAGLLTADQNSLDLDLFGAAATGMDYEEMRLDELTTPLNETQRSQSVPLSQLQRIHSPTFNRSLQVAPYSACTSVAQTPVPHEFADSSTLFSENSSSQNSGGGGLGGSAVVVNTSATLSVGETSAAQKLDEAGVLASDSTAIFDSLYVSDILPEDFVTKFPQANTTTTTCSSAGSSSGYSTTTFGSAALISGGGGGGGTITSRSVPSTPLPHQQQQSPFSNFYGGRRRMDDDAHLSPLTAAGSTTFTTTSFKYGNNGGYDMSRSMPTTPITTPNFRYSPTEFSRDFLSNGNTIDSLISGGANGTNGDASVSDGLNVALANLNANDTLIDDSCGLSTDAFVGNAVADAETMMAEADLLGNL